MTQTSIPVEQQHPIAAGCAWCGKPTSTQTSISYGSSGKGKREAMLAEVKEIQARLRRDGFSWA